MFINAHTHNATAPAPKLMVYTDLDQFGPIQAKSPFCIGIHPWFIHSNSLERLDQLLSAYYQHPNFVALGEIGLDKEKDDYQKQLDIFEAQLDLAKKYNISRIVLHCVRAQSDLLGILKNRSFKGALLWHGLNANIQQVEQIFNSQFTSFIGLGHLIFSDAKIVKALPHIPLEAILLETDDKHDLEIKSVYQQAAKMLNCELAHLEEQVHKNYQNFLNFGD